MMEQVHKAQREKVDEKILKLKGEMMNGQGRLLSQTWIRLLDARYVSPLAMVYFQKELLSQCFLNKDECNFPGR